MSTNNLDLFSYLPGLEATDSELLESELAVQQILKAQYPTLDLREGTALRDLVIRPNATLLALVNKALVLYFQNNNLSQVDDTTPTTFVDSLMSNWFLARKSGVNAVINARLYFAKQKTVALYPEIFFSTNGTLKFLPVASTTYATTDMTFEAASNQYYIDVDLMAESPGTSYNITTGSLLYFTNFDPYFLRAEINYLRQTAQDVETNTEFLARAPSAISTRNNINVPSITTNLTDYFSALPSVKVVGMGDPEMTRDQIKVLVPGVTDPVWIHNGGKVDVYCRTTLASSIVQLTTDINGQIPITGSMYKVERSSISGGASADTLPVNLTKTVTSLVQTGGVATATVTAHGYMTGQSVTIYGADQNGYNSTFTITVVNSNTFTFPVDSSTVSPATGTITSAIPVPFTIVNTYLVNSTPTSITQAGSVVTVTASNHGLMVGDRVNVSGANQLDYNGVFVVASVPTKDTFTYSITTNPVSPATGALSLQYVDRYNDIGFSDRQSLTVNFGPSYPNQTASFTVYFHENMDGYQAYLANDTTRVLCGDLLARGFNLCLLDLTITAYNGPAPDATACNTVVIGYLAGLEPGQPFVMSDLLAKLYAAGITTIKTPVGVNFTKYWNDMLGTTTGTIVDVHNPNDTCNLYMVNTITTTSGVIS